MVYAESSQLNSSDLKDLTQVLQSFVQEFVGLFQELPALLQLGPGEGAVEIVGADAEPGQERVVGRHLTGLI